MPPAFSACKIDGKRAYDLARKGHDVELKAKRICIHELELLHFDPDAMTLDIRVRCSKGTYIRSAVVSSTMGPGVKLNTLKF